MAVTVNTSAQFAGAITRTIDRKALQVAQRYLVLTQFAEKKKLDHGHGVTWTANRWNRLPLPTAPVSEGVPPPPNALTFTQVTGIATQWAGRIVFTDVATVTVQEDLLEIGSRRLGMQLSETKERNGWNALNACTQVNYVASAGSRAALVAGNNLDPTTLQRTATNLKVLGAPLWNGQTGETIERSIEYNLNQSHKKEIAAEHLVAVGSPLVWQDVKNNPLVVNMLTYQDGNKLYTNQLGMWSSIMFVESNIMPSWTGVAAIQGANASGNLTTATYTIQVTGWDNQNFYESRIYQLSNDVSVTTGGISVTTPSTAGFTYAVYIGVGSGAAPVNLGLTSSGPTTGPYTGQAIQIPPSTTVTITGVGLYQIPPAAPATGVTVYPTYVFGKEAFATLKLMDVQWNRLYQADKSDPHNQLRVIGYKYMEGWCILNQMFLARIESTASSTGTFG